MVCQVIHFIPHSAIQAIKNYRFIRLLLDLYAVRKIRPGSIYMNKNNLVEWVKIKFCVAYRMQQKTFEKQRPY